MDALLGLQADLSPLDAVCADARVRDHLCRRRALRCPSVKINRTDRVQPPKLASSAMQKQMGQWIGAESTENVMGAYLLTNEMAIAKHLREEWRSLIQTIDTGVSDLGVIAKETDEESWELAKFYADQAVEVARSTCLLEKAEASKALAQVDEALDELINLVDTDLADRYDRSACKAVSPLDALAHHRAASVAALRRWNSVVGKFSTDWAAAEKIRDRRVTYTRSPSSLSMDTIDLCTPERFEELCGWRLQMDGLKPVRIGGGPNDEGADNILTAPDGRNFVAQIKHTTIGATQPVSVLHQFNGTAEPLHHADVKLFITNGSVTASGRDFAKRVGIHVFERFSVQRWMTWGDSLTSLTGVAV